jgi:hypothetical protein
MEGGGSLYFVVERLRQQDQLVWVLYHEVWEEEGEVTFHRFLELRTPVCPNWETQNTY